jgi:Domain of unknown function (DUF4157)
MRTHAPAPARKAAPSPGAAPVIGQRASLRRVLRAARPDADLEVGAPDDVYEREAERVADEVMRGDALGEGPPPPPASPPTSPPEDPAVAAGAASAGSSAPPLAPVLQRCACGGSGGGEGECAPCREKRLQRRQSGATEGAQGAAPPSVREVLRSPGRPLESGVRAWMEPRFGRDFGAVRVHDDARAAASADAVQALAYTVGEDVVFAAGRYAPEGESGRRLLAHELTHTVQQGGVARPAGLTPLPRRVAQRQPAPPAAPQAQPTPAATSVECAGALADGLLILGRTISSLVGRVLGHPAPAPGAITAGTDPLETRVQRAVGRGNFKDAFCMLDQFSMAGLLPTLAALNAERPQLRSNVSVSSQQGRMTLALDATDGTLAAGGAALCSNASFAALSQPDREALYDFVFPQGVPSPAGTFFGQPIPGVTAGLRRLLERAQVIAKRSLCVNAHDPSWQAREPIGGVRPGSSGFHGRNMAIDLEYYANPYIMHEKDESGRDAQLRPVYHRIAGLILMRRSIIPEDLTTVKGGPGTDRTWQPKGAPDPIPITTGELHDVLKVESDAMVRYFELLRPVSATAQAPAAPTTPGTPPAPAAPAPAAPETPATPGPAAAPGVAPSSGAPSTPAPSAAPAASAAPNTASPVTLDDFLARLQATPAIQALTGLGAATTAAQLRAKIASDYRLLGGSVPQLKDLSGQTPQALGAANPPGVSPGDKAESDPPFGGGKQAGATDARGNPEPASFRRPELGFLSIPREVAEALTEVGLRWGAIDFGGASGDVQHFDCGFNPGACR